jgi:XTP/dITP diphosphohydrolase
MSPTAGDWVLASTNRGKLREFSELFAGTPIRLHALAADDPAIPAETGQSFVENALIKARHAARNAGRPALADDSGLCVDALGQAPGVRSARYAGAQASDRDNVDRLLAALAGVAPAERTAAFVCVLVALRSPDDPAPIIATGRWSGLIALAPAGTGGFGYDPVFYDPGSGCTAAELAPARKNAVSHRALATSELRQQLGI